MHVSAVNDTSASLEAVVAVPWYDTPPWPWPIASNPQFTWIRLDARTSLPELGLVMGEIVEHAICAEQFERDTVSPKTPVAEVLDQLVGCEYFTASGGLRVLKGPKCIAPGCCCGIENWREWVRFRDGQSEIWLGHDPTPLVESLARGVRVWSDRTASEHRFFIDLTWESLFQLLEKVHNDLEDFLRVVRSWCDTHGYRRTDELVDRIDHSFAINYEEPAYWEVG